MRIALTGGTGFLGRALIELLAREGHELRCWFRPGGDRTGLEKWSARIEWREGRLGDSRAAAELVRGVDAVVHAALARGARVGFQQSGRDDLVEYLRINLMGSLELMQAARGAGVGRFVQVSSCAVHDVILPDRPLDETHPTWAKSHYGAHKAALEQFVASFGLGEAWAICALRPTGIYGLAHPPSQSRYFELVGRVLRGEPIASARGGKEVHVEDVARAVLLLLNAAPERIAGQMFNCYDLYVAEEHVARIARDLVGGRGTIAELNQGPKNQIQTSKIRSLGMMFGGEELLRRTVAQLVAAHREGG